MNLLRLLKPPVILLCILYLLPARAYTQGSGTDIYFAVNTPGQFYLGDISKYAKNPIGFSLMGRIFWARRFAVNPSIRYDNFKYKPLDKRVGDFVQFKVGITYIDNFTGIKLSKLFHDSTIKSYSFVDCGLGLKLNSEMIGNKNNFAYSIGHGVKKTYRNRMILDLCYGWVNLKLANGITASWLDYRIGLGYRLGR